MLLSFNGWAAEEQAKPSCGKRVVQYLNDSLQSKIIQPVQEIPANVKEAWEYQKQYWTEVKDSNGKRLLTTGKNTGKKVAKGAYDWQMGYWTQMIGRCQQAKSMPGCIGNVVHRVVFVERKNPKVRNLRQYLNPGTWYAAPFTLGPELLRAKYNFSTPSQFVLALPAMVAATMAYDQVMIHGDPFHWAFEDMDVVAEEVPGVDYVLGLYHEDLTTTGFADDALFGVHASTRARQLMNSHAMDIFNWVDHKGDPKYLPRTQDFKNLGILKSDAEVAELSQLAYKTYLGLKDRFKKGFPERLQKAWDESLEKDPKFSKYSEADKALLRVFFTPSVKIGGKGDLELLARSYGKKIPSSPSDDPLLALKGVSTVLANPDLLKVAVTTLENPNDLVKKQERWAKLSPRNDQPFLHRADLPSVENWGDVPFDSDGRGKGAKVLSDELSYWELAFKDPRFIDIGNAYKKGQIDEVSALGFVFDRISAYNDLYAQGRAQPKADVKKLCLWLEGNAKDSGGIILPNSLISSQVSTYLDLIRKPRKLTSEQEEGCRIDVAEYLYDSYIHEMKGMRGDAARVQSKQFLHELNRALSLCPLQSPPRSCPK